MSDVVKAREFMHSTKLDTQQGTVVVICERLYYEDGRVETAMRILKDPKRSYYIARPEYRTNTIKRELISMGHCEAYSAPDSQIFVEAWRNLNHGSPRSNMEIAPGRARMEVLKSPYVYGIDIDIQTLIKNQYMKNFNDTQTKPISPTSGFLDIERDIDTGVIPLIGYTHENVCFLGYLNSYGKGITPEEVEQEFYDLLDPLIDKSADEKPALLPRYREAPDPRVKELMKKNLSRHPYRDKLRIQVVPIVKAFDKEIDLIRWIWSMIHHCRTNFIGVWNIDYDIPSITERIRAAGVEPADIFCHPDLPPHLRQSQYEYDKMTAEKANAHISDYWHWFHVPGYSQFYDAMALYARLRKIEAKLPSYALDFVLKREGYAGKLTGGGHGQDWHRKMVNTQFMRYIMYCAVDCIAIQLMEWANTDVATMLVLCGASHLAKYSRETRKSVDNFYTFWKDRGYILGSSSGDMSNDWDKYLGASGGAVLNPNRMNRTGIRPFYDAPYITTKVYVCVNDIDLSAQYPTAGIVLNACKETKIFTPILLYGDHLKVTGQQGVELFFTGVINRRTESVRLAKNYFNLPGFAEIEELAMEVEW